MKTWDSLTWDSSSRSLPLCELEGGGAVETVETGRRPSGKTGPRARNDISWVFLPGERMGQCPVSPVEVSSGGRLPVWIWWFFCGEKIFIGAFSYESLVFSVLVCLAIGYDFPYSQHSGKFHLRSSLGHGWHYLPLGSECFSPIGTKSTSVSPALSFGCPLFWEQKKRKNTASEAWNQLGIRHVGM